MRRAETFHVQNCQMKGQSVAGVKRSMREQQNELDADLRPPLWRASLAAFRPVFAPFVLLLAFITLHRAFVDPEGFRDTLQNWGPDPAAAVESIDLSTDRKLADFEEGLFRKLNNLPSTDFSGPVSVGEMSKQASFISGLIAAHRPEIRDCGEIARHIVQLSRDASIDPFFVAAIISVESRFATHARSHVGALGLMQIMPATGVELSTQLTGKRGYPKLTNPETNITLGIRYIKDLERQYRGNRYTALAAYNWGPGNISKVGENKFRYPRSVRRYAATILERTMRWRRHYQRAERGTKLLEQSLKS